MEILFEESFEKDLLKIQDRKIKNRITDVIHEVKLADNQKQIKNIKKLQNHKTYYRIKIRDYRIGVEIIKNKIVFTRFLHRKDIYRYFP